MTYTGNNRYVQLIFHTQASCCRVIARMGVDDVPSALYHPTTVRRIIDSCRRKASLVRCLRTGCTPYPVLWSPSTCVVVRLFRRFGGMKGFVATHGSVCRHPVLAALRAAMVSAFPLVLRLWRWRTILACGRPVALPCFRKTRHPSKREKADVHDPTLHASGLHARKASTYTSERPRTERPRTSERLRPGRPPDESAAMRASAWMVSRPTRHGREGTQAAEDAAAGDDCVCKDVRVQGLGDVTGLRDVSASCI